MSMAYRADMPLQAQIYSPPMSPTTAITAQLILQNIEQSALKRNAILIGKCFFQQADVEFCMSTAYPVPQIYPG